MATKTITTTVTLHLPHANFKPFKYDSNGGVREGKYQVTEVAPGKPVTLDADEADAILARFGGTEVPAVAEPPAA